MRNWNCNNLGYQRNWFYQTSTYPLLVWKWVKVGSRTISLPGAPASSVGEYERYWSVSPPPNRIVSRSKPFLYRHQEPTMHISVQVWRLEVWRVYNIQFLQWQGLVCHQGGLGWQRRLCKGGLWGLQLIQMQRDVTNGDADRLQAFKGRWHLLPQRWFWHPLSRKSGLPREIQQCWGHIWFRILLLWTNKVRRNRDKL